MRLITDEQHAQIVEALNTAVDNAKNHAENVHESYRGYYPERHAAADRDVIDATIALATLQAFTEMEVVAWIDEWGNAFPLASRKFSIVGENWKPLYATKEPS